MPTGLERPPVEVQQCQLGSGGPRLMPTGLERSSVEVQQCPLIWEMFAEV